MAVLSLVRKQSEIALFVLTELPDYHAKDIKLAFGANDGVSLVGR